VTNNCCIYIKVVGTIAAYRQKLNLLQCCGNLTRKDVT